MNKLIQDYLNKEASENPEFSVKLAKWKPEQIWDAITKKVRTNCQPTEYERTLAHKYMQLFA